jgi:iron only hydrogenase large subunit-like protein
VSLPTQQDVVLQLSEIARQLEQKTHEIARLDEDAVRAQSRFEVGFARSFLTTDGSMDVRKQTAVLATADAKLDAEIGQAKVRAAREAIRTMRDRLDVGRSLNAAVRAEFQTGAVGQNT